VNLDSGTTDHMIENPNLWMGPNASPHWSDVSWQQREKCHSNRFIQVS